MTDKNGKFFNDETTYATNTTGGRANFAARKNYKDNALPLEGGDPALIDFWYDQPNFGKINSTRDAIFLSETNLKQIPAGKETLFVLDFVADAYADFTKHHKWLLTNGDLIKSGPYAAAVPKNAWTSAPSLHHEHMGAVYKGLVALYLQGGLQNSITSFKDFVAALLTMQGIAGQYMPITRTGFIYSKLCPPTTSGMVIELAFENHGSDEPKKTRYIDDPNFDCFRTAARKFGFLVDKNAPWRLVANPDSKEMKSYMAEYGFSHGAEEMVDTYFYRSYYQDIEILQAYLTQFYAAYVTAYPEIHTTTQNANNKTVSSTKIRTIGAEEGQDFWLSTYFRIRLNEANVDWSERRINTEIQKMLKLNSALDNESALGYINDKTKR